MSDTSPDTPDTLEVSGYSRFVRRHWLVCCLLGLVGFAIGMLGPLRAPATYRSTVEVFAPATPAYLAISVDPAAPAVDPREWTQDTEAALLLSEPVLTAVARRLPGHPDPATLTGRVEISVPTSTRVYQIGFTDTDPRRAQEGARVLAVEFARYRAKVLAARAERVATALDSRRHYLQNLLDDIPVPGSVRNDDRDGDSDDPSPAPANLVPRGQIQAQIGEIDDALTATAFTGANTAAVVRSATLPERPERHNPEVPPMSGLMAGLAAGLAVGAVREWKRPAVRDVAEVTAATGLAPVAVLSRRGLRRPAGHREAADLHPLAVQVRLILGAEPLKNSTGASTGPSAADPPVVLVTGHCTDELTAAVADHLRTALASAGHAAGDEPLVNARVPTSRPDARDTFALARAADVVLLVADLAHSTRTELDRCARLLTRAAGPRVATVAVGDARTGRPPAAGRTHPAHPTHPTQRVLDRASLPASPAANAERSDT
ncbi:hypothetical protein SAMN05421678_102451 [Actinopolymorpha cephalotaxi]|uniref:Capsular polysaccharide biosynthesis protein n=1 Tax=Actinopolymorpha cephalotaxi TaxID=504797 RepID=A0A1I2MAJ7_9ACTN|nr:hypothetical protein [Actinopolymorpha cephalotaxi]NYH81589.1 capsular polysaccharide biosynthesis protein [Actinopolymorpha cephalotaxi]SFF86547.1 hypothetical protein SAMN05421678_102451 [Actinopolymorpha cephalotaxi]